MIKKSPTIVSRYTRKKCLFCKENIEPTWQEVENLRSFITERGKIIPRAKTGVCIKHQKKLTKQIKQSRFLALLPIVQKV